MIHTCIVLEYICVSSFPSLSLYTDPRHRIACTGGRDSSLLRLPPVVAGICCRLRAVQKASEASFEVEEQHACNGETAGNVHQDTEKLACSLIEQKQHVRLPQQRQYTVQPAAQMRGTSGSSAQEGAIRDRGKDREADKDGMHAAIIKFVSRAKRQKNSAARVNTPYDALLQLPLLPVPLLLRRLPTAAVLTINTVGGVSHAPRFSSKTKKNARVHQKQRNTERKRN